MNVTRFRDAPEYFPPNHFGMQCVRLQGREAGPAESLWLGVSTIEPGGYTTMEGSGVEKHYVVLEGHVCVDADGVEVELHAFDSCRLAPHERRSLHNRSDRPARILLAMPFARPPCG
ncbi:cupin domain-containing protein [Burkholderia sp. Bp8963]|uniref:cupin domain-containing protein n=1 Tax=Burkholderia sp. Bp8963 TaxID=2184547 RepID=UPI000F5973CC|nr:cupin domain-containing protein [Burkholderia sp. Bp8963]RQS62557.1 cupin domain-containing protein [Burkholderia sp. Bp8963]